MGRAKAAARVSAVVVGVVLGVALLALAPSSPGGAELLPVVTNAVQVTANPDAVRAHSSPQIAVNPTNGELVVVEADVRGDHRCDIHISADAGRTWFPGGDPMMEPFTECSRVVINGPYATLTFDRDGVLYLAFRASDPKWSNPHPPPSIPRHVFLARSKNGGRSFETTMVYQGPLQAAESAGELPQSGHNDRAMVAVDAADPSHVYVSWYQPGWGGVKSLSLVAVSTDGGRTFGEPTDISGERGGTQPRLAVGPDGTLHAAFAASTFGVPPAAAGDPPHPRPLVYRRSTDHGQTWSEPHDIDPGTGTNRKWLLAADPNSDALYVVWYGNPQTDERGIGVDWHVFLRASTDGGDTWSDAVVVNEQVASPAGVKRYDPGLAIAPNGRVDIAWFDFRNSPAPEGLDHNEFNAGGFQDVYYTWSTDNGRTFHHPGVRVTDRIIDRRIGVWSNNIHSHTSVGIASTDDAAFIAWQDTRNGDAETDAEDVYFASVGLNGRAPAPDRGAPALPLWTVGLAGLVLGMGAAMIAAWLLVRRNRPRRSTHSENVGTGII
ncbi:MAG: glycoside hydrolase, partial [Actinomycetota bacterium]|nr:glycoside hydrolase [Actinomycetota bacterium]